VALAGLYSALRITGGQLTEQTVLFLGAGEAAVGIAALIVAAMAGEGLPEAEARKRCWLIDSRGLVVKGRSGLAGHKLPYAHEHEPLPNLLTAIEALHPTAIIGASGQPGTFTQPVLEAMARLNDRPIVFALSNPTSKAECTAEQAYTWTEGRAIFASGSPFAPVTLAGKTYVPGQGNNAYIFPGVGLGAIACGARLVTDEMFFAAARALAQQVEEADLEQGLIYPPLMEIREVSAAIAVAVAVVAYQQGLATQPKPDDLLAHIEAQMYLPRYRSYV
jgi:malate dehydrogenase (oxaloacetate-decarboxylating)(NADP+)